MKRTMILTAAALLALIAFVGCSNPTSPDPEPIEFTWQVWAGEFDVSGTVLNPATTTAIPDKGGIVWDVVETWVNTSDSGRYLYIFKVNTNKYENGSSEKVTAYIALAASSTPEAPAMPLADVDFAGAFPETVFNGKYFYFWSTAVQEFVENSANGYTLLP